MNLVEVLGFVDEIVSVDFGSRNCGGSLVWEMVRKGKERERQRDL